jgi:hypothetical protein
MTFSARVGGPLASAQAEAASLLQLLRDVLQHYGHQVHLLVFVDCLVVLDIVRKWVANCAVTFILGPRRLGISLLSMLTYPLTGT